MWHSTPLTLVRMVFDGNVVAPPALGSCYVFFCLMMVYSKRDGGGWKGAIVLFEVFVIAKRFVAIS